MATTDYKIQIKEMAEQLTSYIYFISSKSIPPRSSLRKQLLADGWTYKSKLSKKNPIRCYVIDSELFTSKYLVEDIDEFEVIEEIDEGVKNSTLMQRVEASPMHRDMNAIEISTYRWTDEEINELRTFGFVYHYKTFFALIVNPRYTKELIELWDAYKANQLTKYQLIEAAVDLK